MKIIKIRFAALRNEEHAQLMGEINTLIVAETPQKLNVEAAYFEFQGLLNDENTALQVLRKNSLSDQLADADALRDNIFRGLANSVKTATSHFNADKQSSALRLEVVFNQYGDVAVKPYNEETKSINKLIAEAKLTYRKDFTMLELNDWLTELENKNNDFEKLMEGRYTEEAGKTDLKMKQVRAQIDASLRTIIDRVNAQILLNSPAGFENFVNEMNARFDKYTLIMAQRQGRNAKKKEAEEAAE